MASTFAASNLRRLAPCAKKDALPFEFDRIWLDREVADHPQALRIVAKLGSANIDIADDVRLLKKPGDVAVAKRQLILTTHRGRAFKPCQGMADGHLCCGYRTIDLVSGCPMDCGYCILQSYLANNPQTTVYVNCESILAEVSEFLSMNENRFFRIGTGELSDSLALDPITGFSSILVPFFASKRNAILELKTKTDFVDNLLGLKHSGRTVVSWSVNTPDVIEREERGTATLDARIAAARRVADAGYGVGFHLDPVILSHGAEDAAAYEDVIDRIFEAIEPRQISWVSVGLLRYPPELESVARRRFPDTKIFAGELVPAGDRMRYLRFIRQDAVRLLWAKLSAKLAPHQLYLCMETPAVWKKVDPAVTSHAAIEKRLCNTVSISNPKS